MPQNFIAVVSFTIMGWAYQERWNVAVILVTSFFGSFCAMSTLSTSSTLLVDLYPSKSSTATSCYNFIRCVLGAIFMACYAKMKKSMTIGGTFTFISGLVLIGNFIVFIPMKYGMKWRYERGMKGWINIQFLYKHFGKARLDFLDFVIYTIRFRNLHLTNEQI